MDASPRDSLSIGDLAHRSGVPISTLRSWEKRYGFPRPSRQGGGHRRYTEADVDAVLDVLARRRGGLSLAAAIRRAEVPPLRSGSVFAELRRLHPALAPQVLTRRTLVSMSRAIEDECCARAADPVLFGSFQREQFLRPSYDRWRELARTALCTVVFADFAEPAPPRPGEPVEVAVPPDSPLTREWLVVCDAVDLPACLAAVQRPGQLAHPPKERTFEAFWSVDPQVVRDAGRIAASLADELRPGWRELVDLAPQPDPRGASEDLHRASLLFDRMVGYIDAAR
ncbi:DICT sensory domain-containing protein [Nocardioides sp. zg-1228]|uniref:DICT sensory domain-containing protein n=1 Tax=Nocardioides sp. zg-1228 TaxID=2763008 RepID=UPI001642C222|nr:DICT sensory domain-containing protein [Nocardioides sp. zg-1228]MBC2933595.1 MerR family transcriptional regulator [Nocardioides sp. zg-1228]QSF56278.1 MerR family transcriptional regulator [Nocardioides sp. zg-1228]